MYLAITKVEPIEDYLLLLTFENGEIRKFDMKPYLETGIFRELQNAALFNTVHTSFDSIEWDNEADFDPEFLYSHSRSIIIELKKEGRHSKPIV